MFKPIKCQECGGPLEVLGARLDRGTLVRCNHCKVQSVYEPEPPSPEERQLMADATSDLIHWGALVDMAVEECNRRLADAEGALEVAEAAAGISFTFDGLFSRKVG